MVIKIESGQWTAASVELEAPGLRVPRAERVEAAVVVPVARSSWSHPQSTREVLVITFVAGEVILYKVAMDDSSTPTI